MHVYVHACAPINHHSQDLFYLANWERCLYNTSVKEKQMLYTAHPYLVWKLAPDFDGCPIYSFLFL